MYAVSQMYHNPLTQSGLITFATVLISPKRAPVFPSGSVRSPGRTAEPGSGSHRGEPTEEELLHCKFIDCPSSQLFAQDEQTPGSASVSRLFLNSGKLEKVTCDLSGVGVYTWDVVISWFNCKTARSRQSNIIMQ